MMTVAPDCCRLSNKSEFWIGVYAGQGDAPEAIAAKLGVELADVMAVLGGFTPIVLPPDHEWFEVLLSAKDRTRIAAEAMRRAIEMPILASDVLRITVRDDLFRSILEG